MQTSELSILITLAEEMNMRKAAEKLFVSQPALSQRLQSIEKHWGTKIFERTPKGLLLTPAGERVVDYARNVLQREEKVKEELLSLNEEVYGTLKLAVTSIIGQYWLPKVLKEYVKCYPQARISLITGWSSEILKNLYEDDVHVGIVRGETEWKGYKTHLLSDQLYAVDTEIKTIDQMKYTTKPFIQFKSDSSYYQEIQNWWFSHFNTPPNRTIIVDQIETCKQMALNGIGYAILPSIALTDDDQLHKIALNDINNKEIKRNTWLVVNSQANKLKQVSAFLELALKYSD